MIAKFYKYLLSIFIILATAWIVWPDRAYAQGPELEVCAIPFVDPAYEDVDSIDLMDISIFWYCVSGDCSGGGNSGSIGSAGAINSAVFSATYALPAAYNAIQATMHGSSSQGRTSNVNIDFSGATAVAIGPIGDTIGYPAAIYTSTIAAQAVPHNNIITVSISTNGDFGMDELLIYPVANVVPDNRVFIDPNLDGVNYPSWVVSATSISLEGSRYVDGGLIFTIVNEPYPYCTPFNVNTAGILTPTLVISFTGNGGGNRSANFRGALVSNYASLDVSDYGPLVAVANGPGSYTMTIPIDATSGYLCLDSQSWGGSTGNIVLDNFSARSCGSSGECFLTDNSFSAIPPLPPDPLTDWLKPVKPPGYSLSYEAPPIITGTAILSNYVAIATRLLVDPTATTYTIVLNAQASAGTLPLVVGLARDVEAVAEVNHYQDTAGDEISQADYTYTSLNISSNGLYTATLANTVGYTPYLVLLSPVLSGSVNVYSICVYGAGQLEEECLSINDASFIAEAWDFSAGASYTDTLDTGLYLPPGEQAWQIFPSYSLPAEPLEFIVDVYSGTGVLAISIDSISGTTSLSITGAGIYTAPLGLAGAFSGVTLENITGTFIIDYVCLGASGEANSADCLSIVLNPNFDTEYAWYYANGGVYNPTAQNAFLPYVISGTWENLGLSVVGQVLAGPTPAIAPGQSLALQFDARSPSGIGYVSAVLEDSVAIRHTLETDEFYQTYVLDVSALAGASNPHLYFANTDYQYTSDEPVLVDNVCLFVTTAFSETQVTTPPNMFDFGLSCWNISRWLSETLGIDFPGLEILAATTPSLWNPEDWVPWLGAQLWVNVAKPTICVMLAILRTRFFLSVLNVMNWIGGTLVSFANWVAELWTDALLAWLDWNGRVIVAIWVWFSTGAEWLFNLALAGIQYAIGGLISWAYILFNYAVLAWNLLLPSVSAALSNIADLGVSLWNWLSEFLSAIWGWLVFGNPVGFAFYLLWQTFWLTMQIIWDSLASISNFPLTFYQEFNNGINGSIIEILPQCQNPGTADDWCMIVVGFEVVNQTVSHSIAYPLVIISIIGLTILIFWEHIKNIFSLSIQ